MADKVFDHTIFRVAHPLVQSLITQSIEIRKFRIKFPTFYQYLLFKKAHIVELLKIELKLRVQCYYEKWGDREEASLEPEVACQSQDERIERDVLKILYERQFISQAIGFIQTDKVLIYDEFLITQAIMNRFDIDKLFRKISIDFWREVHDIYPLNITGVFKETVFSYLHENKLYLPNVLSDWSMEELLLDFLPIFISYEKFKNIKNESKKVPETRLPTFDECKEILKPLFGYNTPLQRYQKSYLEYNAFYETGRTSDYLGLMIHLDEEPQEIPFLLRDYLIKFQMRKIDKISGGTSSFEKNDIDKIEFLSSVAYEMIEALDKITNKKMGKNINESISQYMTTLSSIIALCYFDRSFSKAYDLNFYEKMDIHQSIIFIKKNNNTLTDKVFEDLNSSFEKIKENKKKYDYSEFMVDLEKLMNYSDKIDLIVSPPNRGKRQISGITCILKEEQGKGNNKPRYHYDFVYKSLKQTIPARLRELLPEVDEAIAL